MKTRRIEKTINWNKRLEESISILEGGEAYAMNTYRMLDREGRCKFMNDIRCINDAPKKSVVWKIAKERLGDFEEMVYSVYNYAKLINKIESARA